MRTLLIVLLAVGLTSCYSFRGISIPEGVETAFVPVFQNNALTAPPTLPLDITEALRDKVRDEARLVITEDQPDIEMRGTLVDFRVSAEAATAGDENAAYARLNRLTIVVAIEYINLRDPNAENWKSNFSDYYNFDGNVALASVQDEAIEEILDNINEKIFNRAFAGEW
ncbi:LPS assembly lipoprotein LptE [Lewinella sp. IMCC34191]|uniref:LPS assembly lipoprotein LptE n=1 Tax=Lewinella sp. IMCC34191 TaxID=2259172 RepID=UPI000E283FCD|nr:LPS assembly lipoprotein LptE [Lewinella sp. IMCC34191]